MDGPFNTLGQARFLADDYYRQIKYEQPDLINIISWQENHLMLAELALRSGNQLTARTLIDEVRASHNIDPITEAVIDINVILEERDKELFITGNRMVDQRRTDNFHLPEGTWRYFPITQSERNQNPNTD